MVMQVGPSGMITTQCDETFATPRGQITTQGIKTEPAAGPPPDFTEAVTGGTGDFAHATGYVAFTERVGTNYRVTFHLKLADRR